MTHEFAKGAYLSTAEREPASQTVDKTPGRVRSPEQERLRVEMLECLLPEYAFLADVVADLTLNPEGHVTWLAMSAPCQRGAVRRPRQINLRLTDLELADLERLAAANGCTPQAVLRAGLILLTTTETP